jgi:hypothetical protein
MPKKNVVANIKHVKIEAASGSRLQVPVNTSNTHVRKIREIVLKKRREIESCRIMYPNHSYNRLY